MLNRCHRGNGGITRASPEAVAIVLIAGYARSTRNFGVVQKVTFLGNTDNVNFGWFAYDSTDGHPKKCYPILNHAV